MQKRSSWFATPVWLVQCAVCVAALVFFWLLWRWSGEPRNAGLMVAAAAVAGAAAWGVGKWLRAARKNLRLGEALEQAQAKLDSTCAYLKSLERVEAGLRAAVTEIEVMQAVLGAAAELTGARGASLVPLDEWGQALPAHTYGDLPANLMVEWNERISSGTVRAACRACRKLTGEPGSTNCPLVSNPFLESGGVYCLQAQHGARVLGMVNLYMPNKPQITEDLKTCLQTMLNAAAVYIENMRLKEREIGVIQQSQTLRSAQTDLAGLLGALLEGLRQAVDAEGARLLARTGQGEWLPDVDLAQGRLDLLDEISAEALVREALAAGDLMIKNALPGNPGQLAAAPLVTPVGSWAGAILLAGTRGFMDEPRARMMLKAIAAQAVLLVDNERALLSLEYRTIMQERARLAREIHDGLAQTLAFLKLQGAQMQNYLAQGSLTKLGQALKQNYAALAEAYLDTRQAIDNLRLTPQQGLAHWLEALLVDLQTSTGMAVERSFSSLTRELPPEVELQVVRILQEALNNVRKHAEASTVRVVLREWNGDLVIEVIDDGLGFHPDEIPGISQYGLRGMRERAELIGADFQIVSGAQQGTTIRLSIPLQPQETVQ